MCINSTYIYIYIYIQPVDVFNNLILWRNMNIVNICIFFPTLTTLS